MANKGLIIGIVALIALGGAAVVLKGAPETPAPEATMAATEAPAAPVSDPAVDASAEAAAEDQPDVVDEPSPETAATETPAEGATPQPQPENTSATEAEAEAVPATTPEEGSLLAAPEGLEIDVKRAMEDRILGDINAPVVITEYASMTCPHCAHFHREIFADVKAKLIDTGKAVFMFRDFPLDGTAMKAAMMARCAEPDKYFNLIEVIFKNQDRWTKAEDPLKALAQFGKLAGMSDEYINLCIGNAQLENDLLGKINEGQARYSIQQTPTFVFNGGEEKFSGAQPVSKFEEVVNRLSAGKKQ